MTSLTKILPLKYPIIQAGMVYVSGGKLAAAAAEAGILGVIGAGSMNLELLEYHIKKAISLTSHPERLAINVPLLYAKNRDQFELAIKLGIRIFITSAGHPKLYTSWLKEQGCTVLHVISGPELALKCQEAGVDIIIAEGFEAGGHNGRDEITTMVLIPLVVDAVKIPVVAAGGIADGRGIAAALALGAQGVQIGTRFVATLESSAHDHFKNAVLNAHSNSTMLMMKKYVPVRLLKNKFYEDVKKLEDSGASSEELIKLLGHGRAKAGMLEGDMTEGEIEMGQVAALVKDNLSTKELVERLVLETRHSIQELHSAF